MKWIANGVGMLLVAAVCEATCAAAAPQVSAVDAIKEAEAICRADGGALWGVSLCGPLLLVDPATRQVWASEADRENRLERQGEVFTGKLPNEINIANTAIDWAGVKWTMIMLPLPQDDARRAALIAHELWHRIQDELGFPSSGVANNHLETRDGRYWLQLEWRALSAALGARGEERKQAITDALLFRAQRHRLFEKAASEERAMELHEGLAEYTAVRLSGHADPAQFVIEGRLREAPASETFVRSFAYATGPAYGLLLDETGADWTKTLNKEADLAQLLSARTGVKLPAEVAISANERAGHYGGAELAAAEEQREQKRREVTEAYTASLVDGPILTIPLQKMNMQFNPGNLVALATHGTVYPNIRIVDVWGILTVTSGGALMSSDFGRITVPAPAKSKGTAIEGNGWKLELKPGWSVAPAERKGSFVVQRAD